MNTSDWHQKKGALFEDFFGQQIPSHYGNVEEEYRQIRKSAAVRDISFFGKIRMTGKDRQRFLNGMVSNDVKTLEPGRAVPALSLDIKGHIQADMKVYCFADHFLLVLQHYLSEKLMAGLDRYIISEDVQMQNVAADYSLFQILGPQAGEFLREKNISDLPEDPFSFRDVSVGTTKAQVIRLPLTYVILCPAAESTAVLELLNGPLVGMRAFDVYRVEQGLPLMLRDMDESNFPQEARLDSALSFNKGCYLGQETIARIDAQGHVNRRLMGLAATKEMKSGERIYKGDREVGKVTSPIFSLHLRQPFAMAYIRREHAKEGEAVEVGDDRTTGIVKEFPV